MKKVSTTASRPALRAPARSSWRKVGAIEGGGATMPWNAVSPSATAAPVIDRMAMMIAPGTRRYSRATISMKPAAASSGSGAWMSPRVSRVAGWAVMRPAFLSPMIARKRPMPAEIEYLSEVGIALTIHSRTLNRLSRMNRQPEMNTAPSAACQV